MLSGVDATAARPRRLCCPTHPREDTVSSLLRAYLFCDLNPVELASVAAAASTRHYARGEAVFNVGDRAEALFVVVDGQLKERLIQPEGSESVFELYTVGSVFGEPGLFVPERTRMVDMIALTVSHVISLPRAALLELIHRAPQVSMRLIEGLASDVRALGVQLGNAGYLSVRERLAAKLLELSRTHGRPVGDRVCIELALPQTLLATMVAATRENVNRALVELTKAAAVHIESDRYHVDPGALQYVAHCDTPLPRRNQLPEVATNGAPSTPRITS
jgi:CRP/FNR family transcriptional regulator